MTAKKRNVAVGALADLFQWYSLPPTHLHHDVQLAAREAGWVPPWDVEDQHEQKKVAGNKSAQSRAGRAALRRSLVRHAHERLKPAYRKQPYSSSSIDALHREYRQLLSKGNYNVGSLLSLQLLPLSEADRQVLTKTKRETLIKDLNTLGIRSTR